MNLTHKDIDAIAELAKEAQTLRNENAKLKLAVKNLRATLRDVSGNIDVSTINNSKRNTLRWGNLRLQAQQTLDLTCCVVQP